MRTILGPFVLAFALLLGAAGAGAQNRDAPFALGPDNRGSGSFLGIAMVDIDAGRAKALKLETDQGVEVTRVQDESPADKAGIKAGDVLLSYNGEDILGAQQLVRLVGETPQGRHVKLRYWRDGKIATATVITGSRPSGFGLPPGMVRFDDPLFRNLSMSDIPSPMLIWKNSAIGIECEPIDSQLAAYFGVKRGVLIRSVLGDSPAEKAGLRSGDVVTAVGDRYVSNPRDLTQCVREQADVRKPVQLSVMRDRKKLTLSIQGSGESSE